MEWDVALGLDDHEADALAIAFIEMEGGQDFDWEEMAFRKRED